MITGAFLMGTGVKRSGREVSVSSPCSARFRMSRSIPLLLLYTLQRGQRKLFRHYFTVVLLCTLFF